MRIIKALSMIAVAVAAGCGGDRIITPTASVVGTYALQSVNGNPLPIALDLDGVAVQLTAESINVRRDGSFSDSLTIKRVSDGQSARDGLDGTYAQNGSTVTFSAGGQVMMTMTWDGANQLTDNSAGVTLIYKK